MSFSPSHRLRVEIQGAVQGVGFRPFVYRLATELGLAGWVINDAQGVFVEVEGEQAALECFRTRIETDKPPRAIIQTLQAEWLRPVGFEGFEIRHSDNSGAKTVLVLPDVATCPDCLAEILNPADRRARYPFTNCTNCGPRFTIVESLPYDRPNTSMRRFVMCPACQREYEDPLDRRFHAQPNACPVCGPRLTLYGPAQDPVPGVMASAAASWVPMAQGDEALRRTAVALLGGQIVALKGLGGFHLMVDARNAEAIRRLRARKPRRDKPFAVMVRDLEQARSLCEVPAVAEALLTAPEAPIVLLRRGDRLQPETPKTRGAGPAAAAPVTVAGEVAPGNPYLGVMLPYTPLHHLLLRELNIPLVATSGNLTDEPICTDEHEAMARLGHMVDLFLVHDRPIVRHVDDSVAWVVADQPRLLRRARGYAPLPVLLSQAVPAILGVGAHLKNTVALSVGRQVFISQHIGDLETPEAMVAFERVIQDFTRLYEATPAVIAHDLHPDYLSTRWANVIAGDPAYTSAAPPRLVGVQHHHAHLAACLAENGLEGPALGVIWDGTGYGTDSTIWGGEFLLGDAADFERVACLRPFRLPGGEVAVKEPRRAALALLWELYGEAALDREALAPVAAFSPGERRLLGQMLARGINAPVTTSAGRLFDGVAALVGLHQEVSFEGQAAMALEFAASGGTEASYPMPVRSAEGAPVGPALVDWGPMVVALLEDLQRGASVGLMATKFHNGLIDAMVDVARLVDQPHVALSGGCFQNRLLTERAVGRLGAAGFQALLHRQVPPNDGCISLGQVAVAAARLR